MGAGRPKKPLPLRAIARAYMRGASLEGLGRLHGVSGTTIRRRLLELGVPLRPRNAPRILLPVAEIEALYLSGVSARELGGRYGCSTPTIDLRLAERGVRKRRPGEWSSRPIPEEVIDAVVTLYREGELSKAAVARVLGLSVETVRRVLRERKVKTRPVRRAPHGSESRFTNQGCRCARCRQAMSEARLRRRRRRARSPKRPDDSCPV
jgi:predicted HTH domain antitoxin